MRIIQVFLLIALVSGSALAQQQADRSGAAKSEQELRRAQLRLLLATPRVRDAKEKEQALESEMQERRLSAQERADLRQLLRQQQRETKLERP